MKTDNKLVRKQANNAIKWIDALKGNSGFKKTTSQLGRLIDTEVDLCFTSEDFEHVKDLKKEMQYCCLGVACRVMKYKDVNFSDEVQSNLPDDIGLFDAYGTFMKQDEDGSTEECPVEFDGATVAGLTSLNDETFTGDKNFKNVRNFILKNLDSVFKPEVSSKLKKHYKSN